MRIDFSELTALAAELEAAPIRVAAEAPKLVRDAVRAGAETARDVISGQIRGKYLPHYPKSISHEASGLRGEFGPDASRPQGGMGPGVEFGSVNTRPHAHMQPAGDRLEEAFPNELADLAAKALFG